MVKVEVFLFGALSRVAGKKRVEVEAMDILEVLRALTDIREEFKSIIFDDHKNLRRFIYIYINGRDIRFLNKLKTYLNEGDIIQVIPAVSGG